MAARDKYHNAVRAALEADGWTITDDPFQFKVDGTKFQVDLGAEKLLAAEKEGRKIVVEIKSFLRASLLTDFHHALGQCMSYKSAMRLAKIDRILYLAVPIRAYDEMQDSRFYFEALRDAGIHLLVFDIEKEKIISWTE